MAQQSISTILPGPAEMVSGEAPSAEKPITVANKAARELLFGSARAPLVVSYGAGVDSTAMLVEMHRRGIRPDAILFADTGNEKLATMAYLPIIGAWLEKVGFPALTVVKNPRPRVGDKSLGEALLRTGQLPAIAFGGHQCSLVWKIAPQDAYLRRQYGWNGRSKSWATVPVIVKAIGYDDGARDRCRALRAWGAASPGCVNWFPLQEWGLDRDACKAAIEATGLPAPVKSSCVFCQAMSVAEINDLARTEPDNFMLAIAIEDNAKAKLRTVAGLGRRFSWRTYVETKAPADVREVLLTHPVPAIRERGGPMPNTQTSALQLVFLEA